MINNNLTWFELFDVAERPELPYLERDFDLQGYGAATLRLCRGNLNALVFNGVYLPANLNGRNPFITRDGLYGAYTDTRGKVWLGIKL